MAPSGQELAFSLGGRYIVFRPAADHMSLLRDQCYRQGLASIGISGRMKSTYQPHFEKLRSMPRAHQLEVAEVVASSLKGVLPVSQRRRVLLQLPWSDRIRGYWSFWRACRRLSIRTVDDFLTNISNLAYEPGLGTRKLQVVLEEFCAHHIGGVVLQDPATLIAEVRHTVRAAVIRKLIARLDSTASRPKTVDLRQLFGRLILFLPQDRRQLAIGRLPWSRRNPQSASLWANTGVSRVADLAAAGARLSPLRSLGSQNLLEIVADLVSMDPRLGSAVPVPRRDSVKNIEFLVDRLSHQPSPNPDLVTYLFSGILNQLPATALETDILSVPWSRGWCFETEFWSVLGVRRVSDLRAASQKLRTIRGIGRGKILQLAGDLVSMDPAFHSKLAPRFGAMALSDAAAAVAAIDPRDCDAQIGEWASHLSPVDRDILQRRLLWQNQRSPATLAAIAAEYGLTRSRVQQRQRSLAQKLCRLPALRRLRETLQLIAESPQRPDTRSRLLRKYREEIDFVLDNLEFLSRLFRSDGGGPAMWHSPRVYGEVIITERSR